jgi:hypothetical protein
VDVQEFLIVPYGAERFSGALRIGVEVFHAFKRDDRVFRNPPRSSSRPSIRGFARQRILRLEVG